MTPKERLQEEYDHLRRQHGMTIAKREGFDMEKEIERILQSEKEERGEGFDTERRKAELRRAMAPLYPDNATFNPMIEKFAKEIESSIRKVKPTRMETVFAGEFITGDFNACALRATNGILVLINTGVMNLIHQVTTLLGYRVRMNETDSDILEPHRAVPILADTAISYLVEGDSLLAERVPPLYGAKGNLIAGLRRECERFVLAHEYGHAIGGHLSGDNQETCESKVARLVLIKKSWEQEFEADRLGLKLLLAEDEDYIAKENEFRLTIREKIAGTFLFFSIVEFISQAAAAVQNKPYEVIYSETHPPSGQRIQELRAYLRQLYPEKHVENSLYWSRLLHGATEVVTEFIRGER